MVVADAGGVLVDQTMVSEASWLLHGRMPDGRHRGLNAERLMQLSLLLDAVVLYDRLYVLPGQLPVDVGDLELRAALVQAGVLQVLDTSQCQQNVAEELGGFITASPRGVRSPNDRLRREVTALVRSAVDGTEFAGGILGPHLVRAFRDGVDVLPRRHRHPDPSMSLEMTLASPVESLGTALLYHALGSGTASNELTGAAYLRTLVYWRTAAHMNLPFYPSCMRLPHYYQLINHVGQTTQDAVYGAVAESFHATVTEIYADDDEQPIYLPPALTLFLDHRRHGRDIYEAVHQLRRDHQPLRTALAQLRTRSAEARSLAELRTAKRRFREVLAQLRTDQQPATTTIVDQALDLAPAITRVLTNPLDVTGYSARLLQTPREWIRRWWLRRPYRLAFRLRERLLAVREYEGLATDLDVTSDDLAAFAERFLLTELPSAVPPE
jgi:hypothetical protein